MIKGTHLFRLTARGYVGVPKRTNKALALWDLWARAFALDAVDEIGEEVGGVLLDMLVIDAKALREKVVDDLLRCSSGIGEAVLDAVRFDGIGTERRIASKIVWTLSLRGGWFMVRRSSAMGFHWVHKSPK